MSKPQINVTPLIDVLLVLLIIFMVITPPKPSAFEARIPGEPDNDPSVTVRTDTMIVSIGDDTHLRLNRDDLAATVAEPARLVEKLRGVFELRNENFALAERQDGRGGPHVEKNGFYKSSSGIRLRKCRESRRCGEVCRRRPDQPADR
ncbi:MAG: biopolymer transporter ExbD [Acidobacteriota bacterium]